MTIVIHHTLTQFVHACICPRLDTTSQGEREEEEEGGREERKKKKKKGEGRESRGMRGDCEVN